MRNLILLITIFLSSCTEKWSLTDSSGNLVDTHERTLSFSEHLTLIFPYVILILIFIGIPVTIFFIIKYFIRYNHKMNSRYNN
ncbi:hypothetical protein FHS70_003545 [Flammeovirga yaeyamensis]|nr:hypothetical protein [Flammeovirga yaeyamensis]